LIYINSNDEKTENENTKEGRELTKLEKIIEIIKSIDNGKIIIFSAYNNTFSPICHALLENDVTFVEVKGTAKTRQKNIYSFRKGNVSVIFLNSTINSAGINLQEASDIILYHEMDDTTEKQIIGRANRIGRTLPLKVHYLQIKK
jgi:SNF2 family DNA or RNA helicase